MRGKLEMRIRRAVGSSDDEASACVRFRRGHPGAGQDDHQRRDGDDDGAVHGSGS
jgi:hypothetical protein